MAKYGYDEVNERIISEDFVEEHRLVAGGSSLGKTVSSYLQEIVVEMLFFKFKKNEKTNFL